MEFRVRTFQTVNGRVVEQVVEAASANAARQIGAGGGVVLSVEPVKSLRLISGRPVRFDVGLFCSEMRTLLRAGLGVVEALDALIAKSEEGAVRAVYRLLHDDLLEGRSLATALSRQREVFPAILIAAIQSSERTGRVGDALGEFSAYFETVRNFRRKITNAAVYPILVSGFGFVVACFLLFFVIPRFASIYDGLGPSPSFTARILVSLSAHLAVAWPIWMLAVLALMGGGIVAWLRGDLARWSLAVGARVPWVAKSLWLFQLAQVYRSLSMLLRGGFTLLEAISLAQPQALQEQLNFAIGIAAKRIEEGQSAATAFHDAGLTDPVSIRLIHAGERSGDMPSVFDAIANDYSARLSASVERTMRLAEPVLMVFVGGLIGVLVVLMYMPVFDLAGAINP